MTVTTAAEVPEAGTVAKLLREIALVEVLPRFRQLKSHEIREKSPGDFVTVSVSYQTIDLHFPFVPFINNGEVTQTAEARVEYAETQPEEC